MKIRIVKTPLGSAPEDIRNQWVGLELEAHEERDDGGGYLRIGSDNVGGYKVSTKDAIDALTKEGRQEAADFWQSKLMGMGTLVFKAECCEVVE